MRRLSRIGEMAGWAVMALTPAGRAQVQRMATLDRIRQHLLALGVDVRGLTDDELEGRLLAFAGRLADTGVTADDFAQGLAVAAAHVSRSGVSMQEAVQAAARAAIRLASYDPKLVNLNPKETP